MHDTCKNVWLRAKQKNIASKDKPHKANGSSLKQNTFGVEQECQTLYKTQILTFWNENATK